MSGREPWRSSSTTSVSWAAGDVADYLIGLVVEWLWPQASLVIFLLLYFVFLWIAWLLAVKMTGPKDSKQVAG